MAKILLVDDEPDLLKALTMILRGQKHDVTSIADGREAERLIRSNAYDLIISDIHMTPVDGLQLLNAVQEAHPETPVILITAYATLDIALKAIKLGAFDFVTKPFRTDDCLATVQRALDYPRIVAGNIQLDRPSSAQRTLIAKSQGMQTVYQRLEQLAVMDEMVLILGERGTGKHLVAQTLHGLSRRKNHPFIAVDCAAGKESDLKARLLGQDPTSEKAGVLNAAAGGTVLLENVEGLPADVQPHILHLIKARESVRPGNAAVRQADVRILAASRSLPTVQSDDPRSRAEWIQTLTAIPLQVPPLRERSADLLLLISQAVYHRADPTVPEPWKLSAQAYDILERYPWPGNVEELEHTLTQAVASARNRLIGVSDLPRQMVETVPQMKTLSQQQLLREELRGKSFRDYVRLKQKELSPILRPENRASRPKG